MSNINQGRTTQASGLQAASEVLIALFYETGVLENHSVPRSLGAST